MSYAENPYRAPLYTLAANAAVDERADFIRKTYLNLGGAVLAFAGLEAALLQTGLAESFVGALSQTRWGWAIVLGAFMLVSWVAENWARSSVSTVTQYMGLSLYVVAEAVLFLPLLYIANRIDERVIPTAALATGTIFIGLTAIVFMTRKDFSFLRTALGLGGLVAMALILASIFFGFSLGMIFSVAMVAFAGGYILYDTSNVLHHYRIGQHVAAALALFASVALLFWYILRIVLAFTQRD
ncbi:MAG TPA: Bax inhibitor-1 family protein [Pirellulales bacterium]|nr:Bax inhibitor-1 family protein [Pirellulales bacterium]